MKTGRIGALARTMFVALWMGGFVYHFPLDVPEWLSERVQVQNRPFGATISFGNGIISIGSPLRETPPASQDKSGSASPTLTHKCCEAKTQMRNRS